MNVMKMNVWPRQTQRRLTVGDWSEFQNRVQGTFQVWELICGQNMDNISTINRQTTKREQEREIWIHVLFVKSLNCIKKRRRLKVTGMPERADGSDCPIVRQSLHIPIHTSIPSRVHFCIYPMLIGYRFLHNHVLDKWL